MGQPPNPKRLRKVLTDKRFLSELHHLLWRPHFDNHGKRDEGWMCRDHAFLVAGIGALCGYCAALCWGKVALVGPTSNGSAGLLSVDEHAWAGFEGVGFTT